MSKWGMADALDVEVKAIGIVTLYAKYLSGTFSELPQPFLIKFKTNSTFHAINNEAFGFDYWTFWS